MAPLRRIVVDILKPHDPSLIEFTNRLADIDSVAGVTTSLIELDNEVQNIKLTFEGEDIDFDAIDERVEDLGATIHSIDQVGCGEYVVQDRPTPQDN